MTFASVGLLAALMLAVPLTARAQQSPAPHEHGSLLLMLTEN